MMLAKPDGCSACVLKDKGKGFVPDKLVNEPLYTIYGEAPGSTELEAHEPFKGKAGFVLRQWIMKAVPQLQLAEERGQISYRNILKCLPPEQMGRAYPRGKDKEAAEQCCSQYRQDNNDAATVILCGEVPQRYFFKDALEAEDVTDRSLGHDLKGVMGRVGRVYNRDGRIWVFAPHPAFILRQPALVGHGQAALKIATQVDKIVDVDYVKWESAIESLIPSGV